jgi:cyanophycinase-like exopeptidase
MIKLLLTTIVLFPIFCDAQNFTSYAIGNTTDVITSPLGGICLMGGATEDDHAMKWFLQRANGGDVLVLRTSGSNGYNSYLYSGLGVPVNSVETIVCHNALASSESYLIQKIHQAEAIWFAGGDQWTYVSYWRNSAIDSAINQAIMTRNIVIGGTSAGMAIQGKYYFSAQNGTVTSLTALADPYSSLITVDSSKFIDNNFMKDIITDTHFDDPDRKGRLVTFLARIKTDYGISARAIACDEYTAVCINSTGIAHVFGGYPTYDDNAYFVQTNCELPNPSPETCSSGNPLTWNLAGNALKVYQIKGDSTGNKTFNLNTWQTGVGGSWNHWSVSNGSLQELSGSAPNCAPNAIDMIAQDLKIDIYPNPTPSILRLNPNGLDLRTEDIQLYNYMGEKCLIQPIKNSDFFSIDLHDLQDGIYFMSITTEAGENIYFKILKN